MAILCLEFHQQLSVFYVAHVVARLSCWCAGALVFTRMPDLTGALLTRAGSSLINPMLHTHDGCAGAQVLLFSYSTRMLDLIGAMLTRAGYVFQRLDGTTKQADRQTLVDTFNTSPSAFLFLISTGAGSLGLNLTGANKCARACLRLLISSALLYMQFQN